MELIRSTVVFGQKTSVFCSDASVDEHIYDGDGKKISSEKEAYCVYKKKDRIVRVGTKEPEISEEEPEEETEESGDEIQ